MKYRNKITNEIVVANTYALKYMCEHNTNFEKIEEKAIVKDVEEKEPVKVAKKTTKKITKE